MSAPTANGLQTSENELIREILAALPSSPELIIQPGDDCAAVRPEDGHDLILTSDPVILGTHFDDSASPSEIGHKAAGRVLSDLAAMGAVPRWLLINITAPHDYPHSGIKAIMAGASALASDHSAVIAGGDLSSSALLSVHAFACGTLPSGTAVRRCGAKPGDMIFVTGTLGDSRSGKHLSFTPRVSEGIWLRENAYPSSMIDTSDGAATDLRHILHASGVGAALNLTDIPCPQSLQGLSDFERAKRALCDGEDFELLFTVPPQSAPAMRQAWQDRLRTQLSCIGTVTADRETIITVDREGRQSLFSLKGFDHFAKDRT